MPVSILAKRYAKAVLALAVEAGEVEQTATQLQTLADTLLADKRSKAFWITQRVGEDEKRHALQDVLETLDASATVRNTANFMLERRRLTLMGELVEAYHEMANAFSKVIEARVTSAGELSSEQLQQIAEALGRSMGKKVELTAEVDPSLIGGIKVQTEDRIIDGSVRGRLAALARSIR